ncbi:MAG: OsmC family protein [Rhizomicrobium sp.]
MSIHQVAVRWQHQGGAFTYDSYSRDHDMVFKQGQIVVAGSAAPQFRGHAHRIDPEEAFVAALASCHMLSFLAICARKRIGVESYEDDAEGVLDTGEEGRLCITEVRLQPRIRFAPGQEPAPDKVSELHHQAHRECFIANSVRTQVRVARAGAQG